jgi:hypothetical protein
MLKTILLFQPFVPFQTEHSGEYICEAVGYPRNTPGSTTSVRLEVEKCMYNSHK